MQFKEDINTFWAYLRNIYDHYQGFIGSLPVAIVAWAADQVGLVEMSPILITILALIVGVFFCQFLAWKDIRKERDRLTEELEELKTPKIEILYGDAAIYKDKKEYKDSLTERYITFLRVGVRNSSSKQIDNVELVLANVFDVDGNIIHPTDLTLNAESYPNDTRISINPGTTKYYTVARFIEPEHLANWKGAQLIEWVDGKRDTGKTHINVADFLIESGLYKIKLKVSASNSPLNKGYFFIGVTENNELIFHPEVKSVPRQTIDP